MNRKIRIESYSKAYDKLVQALREFPKEMWQYKPAPNKWSIHEIIIHIADSEANGFCRAGATVMVYDQDIWTNKLNYTDQSTDEALELFKILRRNTYNLIKNLPEETWNNSIMHPENGKMSMDDWLVVYDDHIPIHINQMKRNFGDWQKSKK